MDGGQWSVHTTIVVLSKSWEVRAFSSIDCASVWLHDAAATSAASPQLLSVFVENRSVVHVGGVSIRQLQSNFTLLSCNFNPNLCAFLSPTIEASTSANLRIQMLLCTTSQTESASCQAQSIDLPYATAAHGKFNILSIIRDASLGSASIFFNDGDTIVFTVLHWQSSSISATSLAPLFVNISQVKAAFLCGQFSCVLSSSGRIFVQNGSHFVMQSIVAIDAAILAFTNDPRCKRRSDEFEHHAEFVVDSAWIGDQELVIHWGSGCFAAVEWCVVSSFSMSLARHASCRTHSCDEQHCFVASWAACVGSDIIRSSSSAPIPTSFYSMVVPLVARKFTDTCPPDASSHITPVMKWWVLPRSTRCSMHHRTPTPSHPLASTLFDQIVDESYVESRWSSGRVMLMIMTIPWRRSSPHPNSLLTRAQMQQRAPLAVVSTQYAETPAPVCFLTGVGACMPAFLYIRVASRAQLSASAFMYSTLHRMLLIVPIFSLYLPRSSQPHQVPATRRNVSRAAPASSRQAQLPRPPRLQFR